MSVEVPQSDMPSEVDLLRHGAREFVSPDAMIAAAAHVEREYGYGYRLGIIVGNIGGGGYFEVSASDGSRFVLRADRYGNVERVEAGR